MSRQFLTFTLNNSLYAIEVFHVQEVLGYTKPAKLPCTASYVEGLINSREQGISVINLRRKFRLPEAVPDKKTRIIVLELKTPSADNPDHRNIFGAVADSVNEVVELDDTNIEPPPKFGSTISAEYISGLGKKDDSFIIILDTDKIFGDITPAVPDTTEKPAAVAAAVSTGENSGAAGTATAPAAAVQTK